MWTSLWSCLNVCSDIHLTYNEWLKREQGRSYNVFYDLACKVTLHHLWNNQLMTQVIPITVEETTQGILTRSKNNWGPSWRLLPQLESYDQPRQHIKKQRRYFVNKGPSSQGYDFSSSHVWMWELHYKESWGLKNWCLWTVVLEKTLESPLDCKEIKSFYPKGNQSWIFGRTDVEAETPILWPHDMKNWFIGKDPDAGKDWRWEEKGMREDETFGWHHQHNGHKFESALGVGDGQGSLACCSPWGHKESDTTERLNWTDAAKWSPQ